MKTELGIEYTETDIPEVENLHGENKIISNMEEDTSNEINIQRGRKTVLVLHGFDLWKNHQPGTALLPFVDTLRYHLSPKGVNVIFGRYNTHESFVYGAQEIKNYLTHKNISENDLYIFAYSMGGLVARQMIANGLRPRRLVTYCTPHHGTIPGVQWVFPNNGALSMMPSSQDLARLNKNTNEARYRKKTTAIGLIYNNPIPVMDDGLVGIHSSTGVGLGFGKRRTWLSPRIGPQFPMEPHGSSQNFPDINVAMIEFINTVING